MRSWRKAAKSDPPAEAAAMPDFDAAVIWLLRLLLLLVKMSDIARAASALSTVLPPLITRLLLFADDAAVVEVSPL